MHRPVPLFSPVYLPEMTEAAERILRSGKIASGPAVAAFREALGRLVEQDNVVLTNDMSSALRLALHLIGVGPGDEVLTPAFACLSTNAPIANTGATPNWVDVNPRTGLMDLQSLRRSVTHRSKAVVVYHLAGYPADLLPLRAVCDEHGLALIEDCDNALGAVYGGRPVGTLGDFAVYSFYPTRQVNGVDGGALICRRPEHAERAHRLTRFGIDASTFRNAFGEIDPNSGVDEIGWSASMNHLNASIALAQMPSLRDRLAQTRRRALAMAERLAEIPGLTVVEPVANAVPAHWALLIRVASASLVIERLRASGVHASALHHRNDTYAGFAALDKPLPGTTQWCASGLALPCGAWMDDADMDQVIDAARAALADMG